MTRRQLFATAVALLVSAAVGIAFSQDPAAERALPPVRVPPAKPGQRYQRLIVLGDWGTGGKGQRQVAAAMADRVRREAAALPEGSGSPLDRVVTTGDNFYEHGVASVDDAPWQRAFEQIYTQPELQVPWLATLGNHDHRGDVAAQVAYTERSERWRMPARYYRVSLPLDPGRSVDLFCLDTSPLAFRNVDMAQLDWLGKELAASTATWKLVVGHHPLYSESVRPDNLTLIRRLEPMFVKYHVDAYVAGHDHVLELLKPIRGVTYVVSGAGAGSDRPYDVRWTARTHYASTGGGFVFLRIGSDELVIEFVREDGRSEYARVLVKDGAGPY